MNTNTKLNYLLLVQLLAFGGCAGPAKPGTAQVTTETKVSAKGILLEANERLSTPQSFKPPVEITIVAKTDSTNLRIGYTADQVIFNWERDLTQLRINGGPADQLHKPGAGSVPRRRFVTIRWVVTPEHEAIYVDGELRFEHSGDYSEIEKPVSVFAALGSRVTVKSIRVKQFTTAGRRRGGPTNGLSR